MSSDLRQEEYTNILLCHLAFYETAERIHKQFQVSLELSLAPELTLLKNDLKREKVRPLFEGFKLESHLQAIGMLYVLFGSRFGARVIYQNIKTLLPKHSHRFFGSAHDSKRWSLLLSTIESVGTQEDGYSEIEYGAETTFSAFGTAMLSSPNCVDS